MTEKEFWETVTNSGVQVDYSKHGVFYKLRKLNNTRLKDWKCLTDEKNPVIKISTSLSFNTFEENISLLFNRS